MMLIKIYPSSLPEPKQWCIGGRSGVSRVWGETLCGTSWDYRDVDPCRAICYIDNLMDDLDDKSVCITCFSRYHAKWREANIQ